MSRSLILIFNLKVTWKFLTTINHIWSIMLSRGEKRSPLKWQYLLLFLGYFWDLILSWRSAYVHKVYKILFCCIQNHSSHLFWWEKVCFTLKSVNNILFKKKLFVLIHVGKIYFLCIKTSFKQMLTHVLFFCYVTKKTPKINPNALGLSL